MSEVGESVGALVHVSLQGEGGGGEETKPGENSDKARDNEGRINNKEAAKNKQRRKQSGARDTRGRRGSQSDRAEDEDEVEVVRVPKGRFSLIARGQHAADRSLKNTLSAIEI